MLDSRLKANFDFVCVMFYISKTFLQRVTLFRQQIVRPLKRQKSQNSSHQRTASLVFLSQEYGTFISRKAAEK